MVLTSAQTTRLLVIIAFALACQANQKVWHHIKSQRNLSRLVVEQIQKAFDAVTVLDRKVSALQDSPFSREPATVEEKPQVVKDAWSFGSSWIAFVQNSKDRFVDVLDAQKLTTQDESLDAVLGPRVEPDERVRQALIWSETSRDELKNAIQLIIVQHKPVAHPAAPAADIPKPVDKPAKDVPVEAHVEIQVEAVEPVPEVKESKKRRKPASKKADLVI